MTKLHLSVAALSLLLPSALTASAQTATTDTISTAEAVVTGTRVATDVRHLSQTITTISRATLTDQYRQSIVPTLTEQTPGLFATSRSMMGYGVSTGAAGAMKVRGVGGGAQLLVLIDGQPQYAGLMGHPIADAYQTMMAEKVEVLRGPASMYYGSGAMAGVVNIVTRDPLARKADDRLAALGNVHLGAGLYNTYEATATEQIRYRGFSLTAGAQYQRTGGHVANSAYTQGGGMLKLGYEFSPHWKALLDLNTTHFNFSNPGGDELPMVDFDGRITRGLASLSVTNKYDRTSGALRGYYDWGHHNINDGYCPSLPDNLGQLGLGRLASFKQPQTKLYKHDDYIAGITWYQSAAFFSGNRTTVGLDWQHFGGSAWNEPLEGGEHTYLQKRDGEALDRLTLDEVGAYVDFRQDLWRWLTLDAGVRFDWHTTAGTQWVPQGGLTFRLTPRDALKASVSTGYRTPTISEMFMFNANADLRPERTLSYELAYAHHFSRGRIGANIFRIDGRDAITLVMGQSYKNQAELHNMGVEVDGEWRIDRHWRIEGNYSYLHMKHVTTGAPQHKLYVGGHYSVGGFRATLGVQHVSGLYLLTADQATNADADIREQFTLLNATASYTLRCGRDTSITFFARGENLLNQHYATYCYVNRFFNFGRVMMPGATVMGGLDLSF